MMGPEPEPVASLVETVVRLGPAGRIANPRSSWLLLHQPVPAEKPKRKSVALMVKTCVIVGVDGKTSGDVAGAR